VTVAGNGSKGYTDGKEAQFGDPYGIAVDTEGNLFVSDNYYGRIRKISPTGVVETIAGSGYYSGSDDGVSLRAKFCYPTHLALDLDGSLYISDGGNHLIRKLE